MSVISLTFREILYGFQSDVQYACVRVDIDGTNWGADIVINHPIGQPEQLSNLYDIEYGDNISNKILDELDDANEQYEMLEAHFEDGFSDTHIFNFVKNKYIDAYYEKLKKDLEWIY